mmetsp:Transcript_9224/g.23274  ORF Transcript_9224/g.23274 Transcript_9224/m.23274 type:complete len:222 (-) Transcript_9224:444-1109(-)
MPSLAAWMACFAWCFSMRDRVTVRSEAASQPLPYSISRKSARACRATGNARNGFSSSRWTSAITQSSKASNFLMPNSLNILSTSFILPRASGNFLFRTLEIATPCKARASPFLSSMLLKNSRASLAASKTSSGSSFKEWICAISRSAVAIIFLSSISRKMPSASCAQASASASSDGFVRLWSHKHSDLDNNMHASPRLSPWLLNFASSSCTIRSASAGLSE